MLDLFVLLFLPRCWLEALNPDYILPYYEPFPSKAEGASVLSSTLSGDRCRSSCYEFKK